MTDDTAGYITTRCEGATETHIASFDADSEPVSEAVVRVVAAVTDEEPETLEPVDNIVDPIVLDALVRRRRRNITLEFTYSGQRVAVNSTGRISVTRSLSDGTGSETFDIKRDESPSETVIRALSDVRDAEPTEIEPLYHYIEPDALDQVVGQRADGDTSVSFTYDEHGVVVSSEDSVTVYRQHRSN